VGRALGDPGLKKSVRVGEAALREAAAFLLDHDGFARVRGSPDSEVVPALTKFTSTTLFGHSCVAAFQFRGNLAGHR